MINDLKLGIKMMKYGHSAKLSFVAGIVLMVFGLVFSVMGMLVKFSFPGGYFIMMSVLLLLQLISTVNASYLVQTSPAKKKLQTSVPAVVSVTMMVAGYLLNLVTVGVASLCSSKAAGAVETACNQLIYSAVIMGVIMLYYGACYKKFIAATIGFMVIFFIVYQPMISGELYWNFMPFADPIGNFALTALMGLIIILVSGLLEYLLSLALYREPISKLALGANLRRQL